MVSPPFHLSSVVSDPSLLFNLMAHTHVHTHTHTHGANIGCGNGSGNGSEAASGASATRGGGALHWGRCGIGVRRHRKRHRRRGGIGCGIGGKAASGAWRHRGLRRDSGARERSGAALGARRHRGLRRHRGRHRGRGGIVGGIDGEAASGASAATATQGKRTRARLFLRWERADVRDARRCDYYLPRSTCIVLVIMLMHMFSRQIPAGPDAEVLDFSNAPWQTGQNVSGEA